MYYLHLLLDGYLHPDVGNSSSSAITHMIADLQAFSVEYPEKKSVIVPLIQRAQWTFTSGLGFQNQIPKDFKLVPGEVYWFCSGYYDSYLKKGHQVMLRVLDNHVMVFNSGEGLNFHVPKKLHDGFYSLTMQKTIPNMASFLEDVCHRPFHTINKYESPSIKTLYTALTALPDFLPSTPHALTKIELGEMSYLSCRINKNGCLEGHPQLSGSCTFFSLFYLTLYELYHSDGVHVCNLYANFVLMRAKQWAKQKYQPPLYAMQDQATFFLLKELGLLEHDSKKTKHPEPSKLAMKLSPGFGIGIKKNFDFHNLELKVSDSKNYAKRVEEQVDKLFQGPLERIAEILDNLTGIISRNFYTLSNLTDCCNLGCHILYCVFSVFKKATQPVLKDVKQADKMARSLQNFLNAINSGTYCFNTVYPLELLAFAVMVRANLFWEGKDLLPELTDDLPKICMCFPRGLEGEDELYSRSERLTLFFMNLRKSPPENDEEIVRRIKRTMFVKPKAYGACGRSSLLIYLYDRTFRWNVEPFQLLVEKNTPSVARSYLKRSLEIALIEAIFYVYQGNFEEAEERLHKWEPNKDSHDAIDKIEIMLWNGITRYEIFPVGGDFFFESVRSTLSDLRNLFTMQQIKEEILPSAKEYLEPLSFKKVLLIFSFAGIVDLPPLDDVPNEYLKFFSKQPAPLSGYHFQDNQTHFLGVTQTRMLYARPFPWKTMTTENYDIFYEPSDSTSMFKLRHPHSKIPQDLHLLHHDLHHDEKILFLSQSGKLRLIKSLLKGNADLSLVNSLDLTCFFHEDKKEYLGVTLDLKSPFCLLDHKSIQTQDSSFTFLAEFPLSFLDYWLLFPSGTYLVKNSDNALFICCFYILFNPPSPTLYGTSKYKRDRMFDVIPLNPETRLPFFSNQEIKKRFTDFLSHSCAYALLRYLGLYVPSQDVPNWNHKRVIHEQRFPRATPWSWGHSAPSLTLTDEFSYISRFCASPKTMHLKLPARKHPTEDILYGLFSSLFGHSLKDTQIAFIKTLQGNILQKKNFKVYQLLMGAGKSSVIQPFLAFFYALHENHDVAIVVPDHLVEFTYDMITLRYYVMPVVVKRKISFHTEGPRNTIFVMSSTEWKKTCLSWCLEEDQRLENVSGALRKLVVLIDEIDSLYQPSKSEYNIVLPEDRIPLPNKEYLMLRELFFTNPPRLPTPDELKKFNVKVTSPQVLHRQEQEMRRMRNIANNLIENVSYGYADPDRGSKVAVPYRSARNPDPKASYTSPYLLLCITARLFGKNNLREEDFNELSRLCHNGMNQSRLFECLTQKQRRRIAQRDRAILPELKENDVFLFNYFMEFPAKEIHQVVHKYNISAMEAFSSRFCQNRVAFSGTVNIVLPDWTKDEVLATDKAIRSWDSFSKHVCTSKKGEGIAKDEFVVVVCESTYAETINNILCDDCVVSEKEPLTPSIVVAHMKKIPNSHPLFLIDSGAVFKDLCMKDALSLLHQQFPKRNLVYFEKNGARIITSPPGTASRPFEDKRDLSLPHLLLYYYDHTNTLGTDMKQALEGTGVVTVVKGVNTFTSTAQGAFRMRHLEKNTRDREHQGMKTSESQQKVQFLVSMGDNPTAKSFRDLLWDWEQQDIKTSETFRKKQNIRLLTRNLNEDLYRIKEDDPCYKREEDTTIPDYNGVVLETIQALEKSISDFTTGIEVNTNETTNQKQSEDFQRDDVDATLYIEEKPMTMTRLTFSTIHAYAQEQELGKVLMKVKVFLSPLLYSSFYSKHDFIGIPFRNPGKKNGFSIFDVNEFTMVRMSDGNLQYINPSEYNSLPALIRVFLRIHVKEAEQADIEEELKQNLSKDEKLMLTNFLQAYHFPYHPYLGGGVEESKGGERTKKKKKTLKKRYFSTKGFTNSSKRR